MLDPIHTAEREAERAALLGDLLLLPLDELLNLIEEVAQRRFNGARRDYDHRERLLLTDITREAGRDLWRMTEAEDRRVCASYAAAFAALVRVGRVAVIEERGLKV